MLILSFVYVASVIFLGLSIALTAGNAIRWYATGLCVCVAVDCEPRVTEPRCVCE